MLKILSLSSSSDPILPQSQSSLGINSNFREIISVRKNMEYTVIDFLPMPKVWSPETHPMRLFLKYGNLFRNFTQTTPPSNDVRPIKHTKLRTKHCADLKLLSLEQL